MIKKEILLHLFKHKIWSNFSKIRRKKNQIGSGWGENVEDKCIREYALEVTINLDIKRFTDLFFDRLNGTKGQRPATT